MANEWRSSSVLDLQRDKVLLVEDGNHGEYRPRPDEFVDHGVAFIRAADMDNGRVLFSSAAKINERARQRITKGIGAPGDVLLSHKGTVGKVALVPDDAPPFVCSPQTTFWRSLNSNVVDRKFLYVFLRSPAFRNQLATRAAETDMAPYVSLTSQRSLSVLLPGIEEQRAIAVILGTLDDKIELNRRMNETLEAVARAIFKSWFADFDPVRAKASGEPPDSICRRLGLTRELLTFFPDRFQESELGEIPEGWHYSTAGLVADVAIGKTPPRKEPHWFSESPADIRWVSIRDMGDASTYIQDTSEFLTREAVSRFNVRVVPHDAVLLSFKLTVGRVAISDGEMCTNEAIAHFRLIPGCLSTEYLFEYLQAFDYSQLGSTSSIAEAVNSKSVREMHVLVPDKLVVNAYTMTVAPLFAQIRRNTSEMRTLSALRDVLLPRLLSGKLRVQTDLLQERL